MLTHYFDVVTASVWMPLPQCMNEIMQILHKYLLEGNRAGKKRAIGFPGWGMNDYKLGGAIRVFGEKTDLLALRDALLKKHADYFSSEAMLMYVEEVPREVKYHAVFYRKRFKREIDLRRSKLFEMEGEEGVERKLRLDEEEKKKYPYMLIVTSKKHRMPLYVGCRKMREPCDGAFGGYGLSRNMDGVMATVPVF